MKIRYFLDMGIMEVDRVHFVINESLNPHQLN